MPIKVLFFGRLNDLVHGQGQMVFENIENTDDLIKDIETRFPRFKDYTYTIAVNREMISEIKSLKANDEVALMPPFSGG